MRRWTRKTYTAELQATVTAFRRSTLLLGVEVSELAARGLDDADFVGLGVVSAKNPTASVSAIPDCFPPCCQVQVCILRLPPAVGESVGGGHRAGGLLGDSLGVEILVVVVVVVEVAAGGFKV